MHGVWELTNNPGNEAMSNEPILNSSRKFSVVPGELLHERYRIGDAIGTGAYGEIFSAIDEQTGAQVAIKALPLGIRDINDTARGRFHREMMIIRNLDHPNIIGIYDWGETDNQVVFMALEYVDGHTLERIVRNQPMTWEHAFDVVVQLIQALQAAHRQGVIHRDLKPANIMLSRKADGFYVVKVLDFGMAKVLARMEDESIIELTREGIAVGTPRYIAPEQARGLPIGPTADLYAVGLLLYEMLTGVQAVTANSVELAVRAHVSPEPLDLAAIEQIPVAVRAVLRKLLEKQVENRYQDAAEVLDALYLVKQSMDGTSRAAGEAPVNVRVHRVQAERARKGGFFMPRTASETVEALAALCVCAAACWIMFSQFSQSWVLIPVFMAVAIPGTAGLLAIVFDSGEWKYGVWRLLWVVGLLSIGMGLVVS